MGRWSAAQSACVGALALAIVVVAPAGCQPKQDEQAQAALQKCQGDLEQMRAQLNMLKVKLAEALANPGKVEVDPSLLTIEGEVPGKDAPRITEGTLGQEEVVKVLRENQTALRACYNRTLKRNTALHHQKITLTIAFKVLSTGKPSGVEVRPNYDAQMNECIQSAVDRWRFPTFTGAPVDVEWPVPFEPKSP